MNTTPLFLSLGIALSLGLSRGLTPTLTTTVSTYQELQNAADSDAANRSTAVVDLLADLVLSQTIKLVGVSNFTLNGNAHIVDGNSTVQCFLLDSDTGGGVTINDLTVQNCYTTGNGPGIHITESSVAYLNRLFIRKNVFDNSWGGASLRGRPRSTLP